MNSFMDTLRQLGPARMGIMGAVILGLVIFFIFVSMRVTTPDMELLYSDLSSVDSSSIAAELEESEIPYKISPDGSKVMVSAGDVGRARMLLAQEGLPNGGSMGYEIFDQQSGFGTTNFVQNINQLRALEGELARTISSMEQIRTARVHLVLPQRELFSRQSRNASASVFVGLRPGARLERQQILSIQSLVGSAVPQLNPEEVSLIDSDGNLLARGGEDTDMTAVKSEEMRRSYEQRMASAIEDILGRTVGFDNVRAHVTADLNFDRISTNEELYDPATQVARSTSIVEENNLERETGPENATVGNNLPGLGDDVLVNQEPAVESTRLKETTNFEISKTVRSMVREVGEVKKLSVAVLVDGTYTANEDGEEVYTPRSDQEIQQLESLVRSAVGFDGERGDSLEVVNMRFAQVEMPDQPDGEQIFGFNKGDLLDAAEIITVAIMVILVVLLVLQPMVGRLIAAQEPAPQAGRETELLSGAQASPALTGPSGEGGYQDDEEEEDAEEGMIDMQKVEGKVKASSIRKVEDIVENYPSETVSVLRGWMGSES